MGLAKDGSNTQIVRIVPKIALEIGSTGMMIKNSGIPTVKLLPEKVKKIMVVKWIKVGLVFGLTFKICVPGSLLPF